jgi:hypothetical protein
MKYRFECPCGFAFEVDDEHPSTNRGASDHAKHELELAMIPHKKCIDAAKDRARLYNAVAEDG